MPAVAKAMAGPPKRCEGGKGPPYGRVAMRIGHCGGDELPTITYDLTAATSTSTAVIRGGATSIARSSSALVAAGTDRQGLLASTATTTGASVDAGAQSKVSRTLWLRMQ